MKLLISVLTFIVMFSTIFATAEKYSANLSCLTSVELKTLQEDIDNAIDLYHAPDYEAKENVLEVTEEEVEAFFEAKGIDISWAWVNYTYTQEWDFYTLITHIDYEDESGKYKPEVYSEVFADNGDYTVYFLSVGKETIIDRRNELPENKWAETPENILNEPSGIDLSQMSYEDLNTLNDEIKAEFSANHEPEYEIKDLLLSLTKIAVEGHLENDDTYVSWAWFDYEYTREWDLYSLTTPIDYDGIDDAVVYAEAYPFSGQYALCFLSIDDEVILDNRDQLPENLFPEASNDSSMTAETNLESENQDTINIPVPTIDATVNLVPTTTPLPVPSGEPILLQKGSKGEEVRNVQLRLIELGYLKGAADGDYGNQTKAAVEAFQKASSLEVTGIITNIDMAKLFASQVAQEVGQPVEISGNLTVQNCELLAKMLQAKNPGNLVGQFITKYKGRTIEFDGNIAYMSNHDGYKTRYDILILYGDFSTTSATGPYFQFRDVNYYDIELTGRNQPDSVHMGQNYHIIAEVVRYDASAELIILKPVSMELR